MPAALLVMDQAGIATGGLGAKVLPRQADVLSVDEWVTGLG